MKNKIIKLSTGSLLAAFLLVGCTNNDAPETPTTPPTSDETIDNEAPPADNNDMNPNDDINNDTNNGVTDDETVPDQELESERKDEDR